MNKYLIEFQYKHWCQGFEWAWEYIEVEAPSFEAACQKIKTRYYNARYFTNKLMPC